MEWVDLIETPPMPKKDSYTEFKQIFPTHLETNVNLQKELKQHNGWNRSKIPPKIS